MGAKEPIVQSRSNQAILSSSQENIEQQLEGVTNNMKSEEGSASNSRNGLPKGVNYSNDSSNR